MTDESVTPEVSEPTADVPAPVQPVPSEPAVSEVEPVQKEPTPIPEPQPDVGAPVAETEGKPPEIEVKSQSVGPDVVAIPDSMLTNPPATTPTVVAPANVPAARSPREFLAKALASIQFRKQKKLVKIVAYAMEKKSITNDDVEKLLHVSDATATRHLSQLVKEGKLKRVGPKFHERYESLGGSIGGN